MIENILIYISAYIGLFAIIFYTLGVLKKIKEKPPEFNEKTAPTVTVIIPAFNEEKGIEETINSALGIDYPRDKLKIIVVDD